jgi:general stress protein 26
LREEAEAQQMLERLLQIPSCTLATASPDGIPQAAVMQFAIDKRNNILLKTFSDSRKLVNIRVNPKASITLHSKPEYAQLDGILEVLHGMEAQAVKDIFKTKYVEDGYHTDKRNVYLRFTPSWIRVRLSGEYPPVYCTLPDR